MAKRIKQTSFSDALKVIPEIVGDKAKSPVISGSVVDTPSVAENRSPSTASFLMMVASVADSILPWGSSVSGRDAQLRSFIDSESVMLSAIYGVSMRNASFAWEIVPSDPREDAKNTRLAATRILENAGQGLGWSRFIAKTSEAIYTQDNGAFWETIRVADDPASPVIGLNVLDPARCTRTGDPKVPVVYQDRKGVYHDLKWYHVVTLEENPSSIETMYNVQHCAVTRALKMSQILRSIFIYKDEKVSGRNPRAIDFVSGVSMDQIEDAKRLADEFANNIGFARYSQNILIPGLDPSNAVSHERVDLASLPDNFSFDDEMKWYVSILAMAFGVDYQEFAPLATGSLGSGSQSETLHMKTQGKGPASVMTLLEYVFNNYILPKNVRFRFKDHDAKTEGQKAESAYTRGRDRALRVQSGELDVVASRYLAVKDGDLPEWIAEDMDARGVEANISPTPAQVQPPVQQQSQQQPTQQNGTGGLTGPEQISGAQQGAMNKQFVSGGMQGIKPKSDPPVIEDSEVNKQRMALLSMLERAYG